LASRLGLSLLLLEKRNRVLSETGKGKGDPDEHHIRILVRKKFAF